jgi:hypothetical protein
MNLVVRKAYMCSQSYIYSGANSLGTHDLAHSIDPDSTKMYKDLKTRYWWYDIK